MNNSPKTTQTLLSLALLAALFFQGCAVAPQKPVYYPPPPAATKPPIPKPPVPQVEPVKPPPPKQTNIIAADFSRQAEQANIQGQPDLAIAILERGLRAAPKEALLWTQLAEIKMQQQQYEQARAFAAKSNSLAGTDSTIIRKNHWIIEESLQRAAGR